MKIPSNKLWTQTNEGEVTGILNETGSMAFDTVGQAKLSRKPVAVMSSTVDSAFEFVVAMPYFMNNYTAVTTDAVFQGELDGNTWAEELDFTPATTNGSDAVVFNNRLVVSENDNLADWDGASDDDYALAALTAGVPHPMCIFDSLPTYKLAIGNGNTVNTYTTAYAANPNVLSLPTEFQVTTLRYRNGYLYIGTKNTNGGEARIFIWNGSGTNAQYECPVGAEWVFSMTEYGSSVAAITNAGQLIQVSGSQFTQLAAFPVYYMPHAKWQGANGLQLNGKVFNRGMITVGNTIYINVEGETDIGFVPEMKSGLWVFDPQVGLYHRASSSTDNKRSDGSLSLSDNTLTTSVAHNLKTGDGVTFRTVSGLSGVSSATTYYVTVISDDELKLSLTREGVANSRFVSITGTPGGSDILVYWPNTDNGNQLTATSGAIALATINETPITTLASEVLWASRTKTQAGVTTYVLNAFSEQANTGSFTTQRIYTDNIEQTWKEVFAFLDGIVTETDQAIIKAQTKYQPTKIELSGNWLDETTINGTALFSAWQDIEEGDELVFTDGQGQGKTAHVTAIENSSATFSVTADEEIGSAGLPVSFYRTNFKKLGTYTTAEKDNEFVKAPFIENNKSPWVKLKVELRGLGTAVNMLELPNVGHKAS
jgi:hypothetical protein